jgi:hypothetical protein
VKSIKFDHLWVSALELLTSTWIPCTYLTMKPNSEQSEAGKPQLCAETRYRMQEHFQAELSAYRLQALRRAGTGPPGIAGLPKKQTLTKGPVVQKNHGLFYIHEMEDG